MQMGKKRAQVTESEGDFEDDDLDDGGVASSDDGPEAVDPEFPQAPVAGGDPDASEFRDALAVTPNVLGISTLLEQEADTQRVEEERATLDALEAMRALDAGETIEWKISRVGQDDEQFNGYLVTWSNSQMQIERISRLLGGGKYHCKGFRRGRYFTHKTVTVAGAPLLRKGEKVATEDTGSMQALMTQMMMMDERRRREDQDYRRQQAEDDQKRADRRQALMLAAMGPMSTVLAALFQNNRTDIAPLIAALKPPDPMQQLVALKSLMPEPLPAPPNALDSAFSLVDKLKDLGGLQGGDGQAGWMDILREVVKAAGPSVGGIIEGAVQSAQAAAHERARQASAIVVPNQSETPATGALPPPEQHALTEEPSMLSLLKHRPWLQMQINRWVTAAQKNAPTALYAQIFFTEAPESLDEKAVYGLLSQSNWFELLAGFDRRVAQFQPWFVDLHRQLIYTLQTEYLGMNAQPDSEVSISNAPAPRRVAEPAQVDRPTKLPSLTGD